MRYHLKSRHIPWAFLGLFLLVAVANSILVAPYLLALFLGWLLATVLGPLHRKFTVWHWKPARSALASTLIATFTIIIPILGFGFLTAKSLIKAITPLMKGNLPVSEWVEKIQRAPLIARFFRNPDDLKEFLNETTRAGVERVGVLVTGFLGAAPEVILQIALALLTCYFVLLQGPELRKWMSPRVPLPIDVKKKLADALNDTAYSSFLSMFVASIAQAIVVLAGFLLLKVPMPMLAFGVAFVFAWFPILGVTPVWLAGMIYLFAIDRIGAGIGMIGVGMVAGLVDNIVRPWVLKGRSDIHPLVSLVAIFGSIHFFGIIGVLVGPVLASCLIEFLKHWPDFSGDLGLDPGHTPSLKPDGAQKKLGQDLPEESDISLTRVEEKGIGRDRHDLI